MFGVQSNLFFVIIIHRWKRRPEATFTFQIDATQSPVSLMGTLVFAPSLTKVGLGVTLHIPKLGFLRQLRFAPRLDSASWCGKLCGILLVLLVLACLWFPIIRPATNIVHSHTLSSGSTPNPEIGLLVASLRYLATLFT